MKYLYFGLRSKVTNNNNNINNNYNKLSLTLYDPGGGGFKSPPPPPIFCSHAFNIGAALLCVGDFSPKIV